MQPQPEMIPQNAQIPNANQPIQSQMYQVIQTESPNCCEKFSKCVTGNTNIPLMVFLILMSSLNVIVLWCIINAHIHYYSFLFLNASIFQFLFALFVWCRMAMKIEKNTSTVKYGYLYLINLLILSICSFTLPFFRIWNFILFETILIALNNKEKKMKFFFFRIPGKALIICSLIYHLIINPFDIYSLIITVAYAFIYNKWLSQKLNISNEKVQRLENSCLIKTFKEKISTFISLEDTQKKDKKQQPLVNHQQDINNSVNMSFIPANMYPNYYSGIIAAQGQQQIQLQQLAPSQEINNPPVVDINQPN